MQAGKTSFARRTFVAVGLLGAVAMAATSSAMAQAGAYPDKPIHLVVGFPPGGGTDVVGRWVAKALSDELKTPVIVDNVPGATGTIGATKVARAQPDGYTLLLGISASNAIAPAIYKSLPYNAAADFTPVARIAYGGNLLAANPDFPAKNVKELIAIASKPGAGVMVGSWGNGSGGHLALEALNQQTGKHLVHVPYKGVGAVLNDLMGGQIKVAMVDAASALPLVKAGRIKALAMTGPQRSSVYPEVPTLVEQGIDFDTASWYGLFAPAKTPAPVVERLAGAMDKVLRQPEGIERIHNLGMEADRVTREAFAAQVDKDIATWARLVKDGHISLD